MPIDMVLLCPSCGLQHVDAPTRACAGLSAVDGSWTIEPSNEWTNPPHRSHLCHGCGHIWRPADVPTNGVTAVKTKGENDSPIVHLVGGWAAECDRRGEHIERLQAMLGSAKQALQYPTEEAARRAIVKLAKAAIESSMICHREQVELKAHLDCLLTPLGNGNTPNLRDVIGNDPDGY